MSEVNIEDSLLWINGLWVDDFDPPREAVDQLGEPVAISFKDSRCLARVIEMCHCEVSGKCTVKWCKGHQVCLDGIEYFTGRDKLDHRLRRLLSNRERRLISSSRIVLIA